MKLIDLGEDVLVWHIVAQLEPVDILNLSLTSHQLRKILTSNEVYHILYTKLFGSNPAPLLASQYNWERLFNLRKSPKAQLYTWGSNEWLRLGHRRNPRNDYEPTKISAPEILEFYRNGIITDISASGYSIQILTNKGELYWTGLKWNMDELKSPGPKTRDYDPPAQSRRVHTGVGTTGTVFPIPFMNMRYGSRFTPHRNQVHSVTNSNLRRPADPAIEDYINNEIGNSSHSNGSTQTISKPDHNIDSNNNNKNEKKNHNDNFASVVSQFYTPKGAGKLLSVSSGREHIVASDDKGQVFVWDAGRQGSMAIKLEFPGINAKLKRISAGWNLSTFLFDNHGLVVCYGRSPLTKENYENDNIASEAYYLTIPDTRNKVVDFMAGNDFILYIKNDGSLWRFDINSESHRNSNGVFEKPYLLENFRDWIITHNEKFRQGKGAKFTKISGCFNNFAVFTDDGLVLLGNRDNVDEFGQCKPEIIDELQSKNVCHVAMGDYHYLALTDDGKLLSWGRESRKCGCLGLGRIELNKTISTPTQVKKPQANGKWLAVAASGWHSCAIFIED